METILLWLVRLAHIATLMPAFFVLWYLAGSDDQPRNIVAPTLGLAVMATALWALVSSFRYLVTDPTRVLWISALPPVLCLFAWPFSGTQAVGRETLADYLPAVIWLGAPPLLTSIYLAVG